MTYIEFFEKSLAEMSDADWNRVVRTFWNQ